MFATVLGLAAVIGYFAWRRSRPKREAGLPTTEAIATPINADSVNRHRATPEPRNPTQPSNPPPTFEGYCMRCKERRTMAQARIEITESNRRAARGTCPVCGATMFKFLPTESA